MRPLGRCQRIRLQCDSNACLHISHALHAAHHNHSQSRPHHPEPGTNLRPGLIVDLPCHQQRLQRLVRVRWSCDRDYHHISDTLFPKHAIAASLSDQDLSALCLCLLRTIDAACPLHFSCFLPRISRATMPLHLLGKKSWNVYNTDNVERVRRDEADAREREDAAEQRMQEQDAERRMALLRGEKPPDLPPSEEPAEDVHGRKRGDDGSVAHARKRRRLKGEDDTDREMRYAREDAEAGGRVRETLRAASRKGDDAPLQDHAGHIQLVSAPDERPPRGADAKKEETAQERKKENEEGHGMRFSDAAGYRKGTSKPWYATSDNRRREDSKSTGELVLAEVQGKDVWGNEDPRRKEREQSRIVSNDPFAMMQQAQRQLKQSEGDRDKWKQEREKEIREQKREEERRRRHDRKHESRRHRRREKDDDDLEGFSLDGPTKESRSGRSDQDRHRRHRHSRRRSRSRSRERRRV
ncbi:hypothetical protein Q7P37_004995 [Cladosporium fusiforme]